MSLRVLHRALVIPDSFKQDLLNRVDIVDVIERYVPLKKTGTNFSACCPFHSEKTPSFTVSPGKQFYHCFGCGANGNAISFLMEYQGMGYVDAVKDLAEDVGMKLPDFEPRNNIRKPDADPDLHGIVERAGQYFREQLKDSPKAIEYLKGRGLSGKVAARFGIGYAPEGWQSLQSVFANYADKALKDAGLVIDNEEGRRYDRFRDRIMFPILNQRGAVIGFGGRVIGDGEPKYLNSPETPLFEKGRELYGLSQARLAIRESGRAIVVEGYMDVVALAQHGVEYAVATLGTATTPTHVSKLLRQTDELVFCFDGDGAGRRAAWHALEVSLPLIADQKVVRFLLLPTEHDPDSFIREQGREAFEAMLAKAKPLSTFLIEELKSRVDMETVEGRARMIHEAGPMLQKVAAPAMQLQLLKQVAELSGMSQDEAGRLCGIRISDPRPAATPKQDVSIWRPPEQRNPLPNSVRHDKANLLLDLKPVRQLLQCLIAKPILAEELPLDVLDEDQPEARALSALAIFLREQGEASTALVIDAFQNTPHEAIIHDALMELEATRFQAADVDADFRGILANFEAARVRVRMKELEVAIANGALSLEEKAEYLRLIQEQHMLKNQPNAEAAVVHSQVPSVAR